MAFTHEYSNCWKDLGSVLLYQHNSFQFAGRVVITEFEDCLIDKLTPGKLYHSINPKSITVYNEDFLKLIQKESQDNAIVVISNVFGNGKLVIDSLKRKIELFTEQYKLPILALFALRNNRLSKPHTGMWTFLQGYYKKCGNASIERACVVSDKGGRIVEKELRNGKVRVTPDTTDLDRAFANNIGLPYHTISEYLDDSKKEKFNWNSNCLPPEIRELYVQELSAYKNPNIFAKLAELGQADKYLIIVYGAPRSGKTTMCKEIIAKWRASDYGRTHAIKRLGRDKYTASKRKSITKKSLENNISVIIDGDAHTNALRKPFEEIAKATYTPVLYVEVNPSLGMAHIFNHVAVESSIDESLEVYDVKEYHFYKSKVTRPAGTVLYCPVIKKTRQVMLYRY